MGKYDPAPYQLDLSRMPHLVTSEIPGPRSRELHDRAAKYYRGLSGQVRRGTKACGGVRVLYADALSRKLQH